ncbi:MAG: NADP-dependent malic enzyme [Minwuiales bacterium]|nr:NADP-dependent malic enzyme [Minwuiales bacterium]
MADTDSAPGKAADLALKLHEFYRGKVQTMPKCPVRGLEDFAVWYTPGVAEPCRAIVQDTQSVDRYTNRGNTIAIVSDATRVLGLGNIGPKAGLPVMEGKALLFKYLGGVDAVPLCLDTNDPDEIVRTVRILEPSFGAINLEDIEQPKCFRVLDRLRAEASIPVWHDDQQGTATVLLAGLINALKVVGKELGDARIAMIGMGAANFATYRLLKAAGAAPGLIVGCDSQGVLHPDRRDIADARETYAEKWLVCEETNRDRVDGGIADALAGADACVAFTRSGPDIIRPEWIDRMAKDAIVFACANPVPEIWPEQALGAGAAIAGTGRSDFPNQVNNSLAFPGIFRGVLDVRARTISDGMAIAAANALAARAEQRGLSPTYILPPMDDWEAAAEVAAATGMAAQEEGLAAVSVDRQTLLDTARATIEAAREATHALMRDGLIAAPPA